MENSEKDKISTKTIFLLISELRHESNYYKDVMKNIAHRIFEVNKSGCEKNEVVKCFVFLIDNGFIKEISKEQHLYEFTETGKNLKTEQDVEAVITNIN